MSGYSGKEISGPVEKIKKLQKGYWTAKIKKLSNLPKSKQNVRPC